MAELNTSKFPIAHEQETLTVGKYYQVACAELKEQSSGRLFEIPIIPLLHADPQLGVSEEHYHIDGRFGIPIYIQGRFTIKNGQTSTVIGIGSYHPIALQRIIYKKKRCIRINSGPHVFLDKFHALKAGNIPTIRYWNWYETMIGKKCAGKKCPHRGAIMIDNGAELVCPLHRLHANKETGEICWPGGEPPQPLAETHTPTFEDYLNELHNR